MKKNTIYTITLFLFSFIVLNAQLKERYIIKSIDVNNEYSNFGTTYYGDNKIIFASPRKNAKIIKQVWEPNDQPYLDLYVGDVSENGEIINVHPLNQDVNSKYHEADVAYTKDLKTVYFTRDNYYNRNLKQDDKGKTHLALFKADVVDSGKWINIVELPFNNRNYSVGHPALSPDDKILYFVTDVPGTYGETDIYKVEIKEDGNFGIPENLGENINSNKREMFPYISDNNVLYFASDRGGSHGNLDIYSVDLNKNSKAVNLGTPINSEADDFAFLKKKGEDHGYFSSNRRGGKGDDDIYYFVDLEPEESCVQKVEGTVLNKKTSKELNGAIVVLYDNEGNEIDTRISRNEGNFSFDLDCDKKYKVKAFKDGFSYDLKEFIVKEDVPLELVLNLGKPKVQAELNFDNIVDEKVCNEALQKINNIYFDLDRYNIRPDAARELDKVIYIMKKCPKIHIRASSHTDSRASYEFNKKLSQKRAESTIRYIINEGGIDPSRLSAVGFGETRLLNHCSDGVKCSEAEHQINRRTQFEIVNN